MDKKKAFDSSTQWISDEQRIHESSDYGRNKKAVDDALSEQQRRVKLVNEYSSDVKKAQAASKTTGQKEQVGAAYDELKEVASHRLGCLQDIAQIASLEDVFNTLSIEFAQRATSLVVDACAEASDSKPDQSKEGASAGSDGIARAAQSCILAVKNNWNWISKLVKCADVHLKHVSDYHQFFHEGKEYDSWMPAELNKRINILENTSHDEHDGQKLVISLKETLAIFLHWQNKINTLFEKSRKIVPVHFRTKPLDHYRPVMSLCDYKTNEIDIQEGEELTLIDNSKPQIWLVRNMHAKESSVPSVICVIPGPDTEAVTLATRLRLQLLKTWTVCLKHIGRVVIMFFTLVFKDFDENTAKKLRCLTDDDKMRMIQVIQWITDIFSKYWADDPTFRNLMTNLQRTRVTVRENGDQNDYDSSFNREYIERIRFIEDILTHFRNYLKQWETYKLISEASQQSDYMLMVENWEQLKYFQTDDILRKVNLGLEMLQEGSHYQNGSGLVIKDVEPEVKRTFVEEKTTYNEGSYGSGSKIEPGERRTLVEKKTTTTTYGEGSYGSGSRIEPGERNTYVEKTTTHGEGSNGNGSTIEVGESRTCVKEKTTYNEGSYGSGSREEKMTVQGGGGSQDDGSYGSGSSTMVTQTTRTTNMAGEGQNDATDFSEATGSMVDENIQQIHSTVTETVKRSNGVAISDEYQSISSSAETEQLMHAEQEERKKFIITGVIDPSSGEEISLDKAVQRGIVNQREGNSTSDMNPYTTLKEQTSTFDSQTEQYPRPPGDGKDSVDTTGNDNIKNSAQQNVGDIKFDRNDTGYLDKQLIERMTTENKGTAISKLTEVTNLFVQSKFIDGSTSQEVRPRQKSIGKHTSRIPTFKGGQTTRTANTSAQNTSYKRSRLLHTKAVSLDQLDKKESESGNSDSHLYFTSSSTDLNLVEEDTLDSGVGQSISDTNLLYSNDNGATRDLSNPKNVLIYTQETVSHLPMVVKQEKPVKKMCTVGTQYDTDLEPNLTSTVGNDMSSSGNLIINTSTVTSAKSTQHTNNINQIKTSRHIEHHSTSSSFKDSSNSRVENASNQQAKLTEVTNDINSSGFVETNYRENGFNGKISTSIDDANVINTVRGGNNAYTETGNEKASIEMSPEGSENITDGNGFVVSATGCSNEFNGRSDQVDGNSHINTSKISLRQRKKKNKSTVAKTTTASNDEFNYAVKNSTKDSAYDVEYEDGDEEQFYLATASGEIISLKNAESLLVNENSSVTMEDKSLQEYSEIKTVHPNMCDEPPEKKCALCLRVCKACLPLQILMLMLLGLACLLPMSEEEYSCALANNFEDSFTVMLKHRDGPPPF